MSEKVGIKDNDKVSKKDIFLKELSRKAFHLLGGLSIPIGFLIIEYYFFKGNTELARELSLWILAILSIIMAAIDVIRLRHPYWKNVYLEFFRPIIRKHELTRFTGATYFVASTLLSFYLFDSDLAIVVITFLVLGDTFAALIGKTFGRIKILDKTLEGTLACLIICLLVGIPMLGWKLGLIGAFVATIVELLPIPLDDNFRIPLAAGLVMQLLK